MGGNPPLAVVSLVKRSLAQKLPQWELADIAEKIGDGLAKLSWESRL